MFQPLTPACTMKITPLIAGGFLAAVVPSLSLALTATSMGSFGGVEEPTVIYDLQSGFRNDSHANITDRGGGRFRFVLRHRDNDWWDGDRATTSTDRQRAEVKVLGPRQRPNETFEYQSSFISNSAFRKGSGFCHIFQVKGYGGGNIDLPLVTISVQSDSSAAVRCSMNSADSLSTIRSFSWAAGSSRTVRVRLKVATSSTGEIRASINGDSLSGRTGVAVHRSGAPEYQPKWGLYRGVQPSEPYGDDYIEHYAVSANKR